jgi:DNA-binding transcriptional regulator YdaS (Cro superfamily)
MFEAVLAFYGSQVGVARLFQVSRAAVSQWTTAGGFPARRALQIEMLSGGRFRAIDIVAPGELELEDKKSVA